MKKKILMSTFKSQILGVSLPVLANSFVQHPDEISDESSGQQAKTLNVDANWKIVSEFCVGISSN